jgi:hypothetical protein
MAATVQPWNSGRISFRPTNRRKERISMVQTALRGALLGAIALSLLTILLFQLFDPGTLKDGQFVLVLYLTSVPFGGTLGAAAACALASLARGRPGTAGWVSVLVGALTGGLAVLLAGFLAGPRENPLRDFLAYLVSPFFSLPLAGAAVLVSWGVRLLRRG